MGIVQHISKATVEQVDLKCTSIIDSITGIQNSTAIVADEQS